MNTIEQNQKQIDEAKELRKKIEAELHGEYSGKIQKLESEN